MTIIDQTVRIDFSGFATNEVGPLAGRTTNFGFNLINFDTVGWQDFSWENFVQIDSLINLSLGFLNVRGLWRPNTSYLVGEVVINPDDPTEFYEALVDHVSTTDFAADILAGWWEEREAPTNTVQSVFGRGGQVIAQPGDYSADQVNYDNTGTDHVIAATDVEGAIADIVNRDIQTLGNVVDNHPLPTSYQTPYYDRGANQFVFGRPLYVSPDMFVGATDTDKVEACFAWVNATARRDIVVRINRMYSLIRRVFWVQSGAMMEGTSSEWSGFIALNADGYVTVGNSTGVSLPVADRSGFPIPQSVMFRNMAFDGAHLGDFALKWDYGLNNPSLHNCEVRDGRLASLEVELDVTNGRLMQCRILSGGTVDGDTITQAAPAIRCRGNLQVVDVTFGTSTSANIQLLGTATNGFVSSDPVEEALLTVVGGRSNGSGTFLIEVDGDDAADTQIVSAYIGPIYLENPKDVRGFTGSGGSAIRISGPRTIVEIGGGAKHQQRKVDFMHLVENGATLILDPANVNVAQTDGAETSRARIAQTKTGGQIKLKEPHERFWSSGAGGTPAELVNPERSWKGFYEPAPHFIERWRQRLPVESNAMTLLSVPLDGLELDLPNRVQSGGATVTIDGTYAPFNEASSLLYQSGVAASAQAMTFDVTVTHDMVGQMCSAVAYIDVKQEDGSFANINPRIRVRGDNNFPDDVTSLVGQNLDAPGIGARTGLMALQAFFVPLAVGTAQITINLSTTTQVTTASMNIARVELFSMGHTSQRSIPNERVNGVGNILMRANRLFLNEIDEDGQGVIGHYDGSGFVFGSTNAEAASLRYDGVDRVRVLGTTRFSDDIVVGDLDGIDFLATATVGSGLNAEGRLRLKGNNSTPVDQNAVEVRRGAVQTYAIRMDGSVIGPSDERLKRDITEVGSVKAALEALRIVRFRWLADTEDRVPEYGMIAQEVREVFPDLVVEDTTTPERTLSIKHNALIYLLAKALQETIEDYNGLESRITALENA